MAPDVEDVMKTAEAAALAQRKTLAAEYGQILQRAFANESRPEDPARLAGLLKELAKDRADVDKDLKNLQKHEALERELASGRPAERQAKHDEARRAYKEDLPELQQQLAALQKRVEEVEAAGLAYANGGCRGPGRVQYDVDNLKQANPHLWPPEAAPTSIFNEPVAATLAAQGNAVGESACDAGAVKHEDAEGRGTKRRHWLGRRPVGPADLGQV